MHHQVTSSCTPGRVWLEAATNKVAHDRRRGWGWGTDSKHAIVSTRCKAINPNRYHAGRQPQQSRTEVIQAARVAAQHVNNCVAGHHGVLAATNTHTHTGRIEEAAALWYSRSVPRLQISAAGVNVPLSRSSGASYISAELSVLAGDWHQRIHTTHVSEAQVHTRADK